MVPFDAARILSTPPGQSVAVGAKFQVSPNGGGTPRWRRNGKEVFCVQQSNQFVAAAFEEHGPAPSIGETRPLFLKRIFPAEATYDVSADGQRLLVNSIPDGASASLTFVTNWPELLRKK